MSIASDTLAPPTLFDLLARNWTMQGPVNDAVFNLEGSHVAFSSGCDGEGVLAIAPVADPERPEVRMRTAADTGRPTILPRTKPVRPPVIVKDIRGPAVPYGSKSFVAGTEDGDLAYITPRGQIVPLKISLADPISAIARDPCSHSVAIGSAQSVTLLPDDENAEPTRLEIGEDVTALAFAPNGESLAVGHDKGVSFVAGAKVGDGVALDSPPQTLSFSPDGMQLACGLSNPGFALISPHDLQGEEIHDYPTPVRSFAWSEAANALATSGAFRTIAWTLSGDGLGDALEVGRNGLVIVERVAASPDRPLIAVGYANGLTCIAQVGSADEMMLRASGGPVSALVWSESGEHLAMGDANGEMALISFPPHLFKG